MATTAEIRGRVRLLLNDPSVVTGATLAAIATGQDGAYPDSPVDAFISDEGARVYNAIASNPTHPRRRALVSTVAVTHGALLPDHVGPVGAILSDGVQARMVPHDAVTRRRTNALSLTIPDPLAAIVGERVFFVGTTCTVDIVAPPGSPFDPSVIPVEEVDIVVCLVVARLAAQDEGAMAMAGHFKTIGDEGMAAIRAGVIPPSVTPYAP